MAEILPFKSIINPPTGSNPDAPDPRFIRYDEYGRPLYCFILEYEHDGRTFSLDIWCYDQAEAELRVLSMVASLRYLGQKMDEVPA